MNRKVLLLLQVLATVVLLALLFRNFDWPAFEALFRSLPAWYYAASLGVILAGQVLYAWRWRALLVVTGIKMPFGRVLRLYLIGTFVGNFLPSTVGGDVAKVYYVGRERGYRPATASVVLDRLLGLGILAGIASLALWVEPVSHRRYDAARVTLTAITAGAVAATALALVGTGGLPRRLAWLGPLAIRGAEHLQRFRLELVAALRSPRVWLQAVATVTCYFSLVVLAYQTFIGIQLGHRPSFMAILVAAASTAVLSNIPITINGLGLREQLHVVLLEPLGVPKEVAVAISLLLFAHLLVASLIGGLFWMQSPPLTAPSRGFVES